MPRTIAWTDGTTFRTDEPTFRRLTDALGAVRDVISGLEPIYERWIALAAKGDGIEVDALAPSEDDRGVLTAALERAGEHAREAGPAAFGYETDPVGYRTFLEQLGKLHELFMTDVTWQKG